MIADFGDAATEDLYNGVRSARARRFPTDIVDRAQRLLGRVNAATSPEDLRTPPSHRLEQLKGDRAGFWSVRVNDQWRVIFTWDGGAAHDVRLTDYHG